MSVFTTIDKEKYLFETDNFFIIYDGYPVSEGHLLIVTKELRKDYFALSIQEINELPVVIEEAKRIIEKKSSPDGYNIGMNCGESAGQTVMHFHCHIIPRYNGDMKDPRGGIRHCVEGKGYYDS